jgi:TRAP-type C4-dicarboxylate transport system permease small subunit
LAGAKMKKTKNPLLFFILNWEELLCILAVSFMTVLCVITIIARYCFNHGISWSTDVCDIMLIYTTFVGGAAAYKRNQHFGMDFLTDRLSPNLRYVFKVAINAILAGMFLFLFYLSVVYTAGSKKLMTASRIPYKYVDFAAVLGFGSMTVYSIIFLVLAFTNHDRYYKNFVMSQSQQLEEQMKEDKSDDKSNQEENRKEARS